MNNGHPNALQYGYSFFHVCLKAMEKEKKHEIAGMAVAIGLALGGKKDSIKEFLKD